MSLLDTSHDYYMIQVREEKVRYRIFDRVGNEIGLVHHKRVLGRQKITLEMNGEPLCTIKGIVAGSRNVYTVKLPDGDLVGRAKQSLISFRNSIDWFNPNGERLFRSQGSIFKQIVRITDSLDKNQIYAEIRKKGDALSKIGKGEYVISITDRNTPRLTLLAFAIIIVNAVS